jgi:hypothetical protein
MFAISEVDETLKIYTELSFGFIQGGEKVSRGRREYSGGNIAPSDRETWIYI